MAGLPGHVPAPRRLGNALERTLRLASPHRPPRGSKGRHRRRCALPVPWIPLAPSPPHGGSANRCAPGGKRLRRSCRWPSVAFPLSLPGFAMYCRRTPASRLGLAARTSSTATAVGRQRGQESVSGGPQHGRGRVYRVGATVPPRPSPVAALRCRSSGLLLTGLCAAGPRWRGRAPAP